MSNFHVGQKVVCVHRWEEAATLPNVLFPKKGGVYTVREKTFEGTEPGLRLEEIINPPMMHSNVRFQEPAFAARRFRPVIERKTNISIFTEMLTPNQRVLETIEGQQ